MTRVRFGSTIVIALALSIAGAAAQDDLASQLSRAESLLQSPNYSQALPLFQQALGAARETGREPDILRALLGLTGVALEQSRAADGRPTVDEALDIARRLDDRPRIADATYLMARIERAAGNGMAALAYARSALTQSEEIDHHRGIAAATILLIDLQSLDVEEEGRLSEYAARHAVLAGDRNLEGEVLHQFADRLFSVGRYEQSLELLTRAAAAYEASNQFVDLGTVYNSVGRIYRAHGRLDEALKYQEAALALHRKSDDQFALLQSLNAVAAVSQRMHDYASARKHLQEAIDLGATMTPTPSALRAQDFLRGNMGSLLAELGELAPAAAALEEVIASGRDSFVAVRYTHLSSIYVAMGRSRDALEAAEKAVALCGEATLVCIDAYNARADAQAAVGNRDAALRDLSVTLRRLEDVRAHLVPTDYFKQDFSTAYQSYYSSAIARQLDAGLDAESLETAELARSRAFLDLLASRSIAPSAARSGVTLPLTVRGTGVAPGAASPVSSAAAATPDLVRIAARLRSTLLLYWVGDGETFVWVVTPEGRVQARRVTVTRARLAALVRDTSPFAAGTGTGPAAPAVLRESSASWRELYQLLIAPVRTLLPDTTGAQLTIVPHDALASLSFAALQDTRGRYLLEDYTLHYAAAGGLFQFTAGDHQGRSRSGAMLMVSDPDTSQRSALDAPLARLPGARAEAMAITRQLPPSRVRALTGVAATESAVREQAAARSILHFASHTIVRDDNPFESYLALGGSSAGEDSDGVLTAQDIYHLNLSADLVVLSSCRSASGAVGGDGVAAFARAFVYAGASSLIASMWEVADEPSNRLLPAFYRAWLGGATKAAALRQAQLRLLADLRAGRVHVTTPVGNVTVPEHPVFWAGFVLFGQPD